MTTCVTEYEYEEKYKLRLYNFWEKHLWNTITNWSITNCTPHLPLKGYHGDCAFVPVALYIIIKSDAIRYVNIGIIVYSIMLEIPNDAYTTLSRNLIDCSTLSQEYCKLIGWYWKIMKRQLWTLTYPIPKFLLQLYAVCFLEEPRYIVTEVMSTETLGALLRRRKQEGSALNAKARVDIATQVRSLYKKSENSFHFVLSCWNWFLLSPNQ